MLETKQPSKQYLSTIREHRESDDAPIHSGLQLTKDKRNPYKTSTSSNFPYQQHNINQPKINYEDQNLNRDSDISLFDHSKIDTTCPTEDEKDPDFCEQASDDYSGSPSVNNWSLDQKEADDYFSTCSEMEFEHTETHRTHKLPKSNISPSWLENDQRMLRLFLEANRDRNSAENSPVSDFSCSATNYFSDADETELFAGGFDTPLASSFLQYGVLKPDPEHSSSPLHSFSSLPCSNPLQVNQLLNPIDNMPKPDLSPDTTNSPSNKINGFLKAEGHGNTNLRKKPNRVVKPQIRRSKIKASTTKTKSLNSQSRAHYPKPRTSKFKKKPAETTTKSKQKQTGKSHSSGKDPKTIKYNLMSDQSQECEPDYTYMKLQDHQVFNGVTMGMLNDLGITPLDHKMYYEANPKFSKFNLYEPAVNMRSIILQDEEGNYVEPMSGTSGIRRTGGINNCGKPKDITGINNINSDVNKSPLQKTKRTLQPGNWSLCPLCPLPLDNPDSLANAMSYCMFRRNDSNYLHHLIQYHGVFSHGGLVKEPDYKGWATSNYEKNPVEIVECMYCLEENLKVNNPCSNCNDDDDCSSDGDDEFEEKDYEEGRNYNSRNGELAGQKIDRVFIKLKKYNPGKPTANRFLKYLRHVKNCHYDRKNQKIDY
ncbi:unnamed protein product [Ambrosiozyma monospora]|uniref:Unnamed protein product n=1 Tax=Ambrosiozyma monospora TaxID=43982 RepID=A0A9W7DFV4_AMBMO|nr:unnamed protein product [Ambrosiozyma monospora]